jgi:NAD(P)-dependent dehydrogenase (short-subunit alcohol dehydrogenase family)
VNQRLSGRVALVTGGSRGIGEAIAERLAREGACTLIVSRKADGVAAAVQRIRDRTGGDVHGATMHTGKLDEIDAALDALIAAHGVPDILVNNAATNPHFGPMLDAEPSAWAKTLEVNLIGPWHLTRRLAREWVASDTRGAVLFISSILGLEAAPLQGIYGTTKAAVLSMTRTLAVELGAAGIRVNAIAPGLVDTKFASVLTGTPELRKMFEDRTPLGRIGQPDDIAGTAAWLVSNDAAYVTGQVIAVDGGYTIR